MQRRLILAAIVGLVVAGLARGYFLSREKVLNPGNISNPKLAAMSYQQVAPWDARMTGAGMNGTHQQGTVTWMQEIAEVSYNYIETSTRKISHYQAEITLRNGAHVPAHCGKDAALVVRFKIVNGLATDAWSDGRELKSDVATATLQLNNVIDCVIRADMQLHPNRYFKQAPVGKTPSEISNEWK
ncbi:MAG: hypothetical protein KBG15_08255 [Kofleriaceae bacterium]|nr:hypothetical protein [Kofleriaceae bacterium]